MNLVSKKSVSPIISAIFLMGVMLVAITSTVTLIYPNLVKLGDQENLSSVITQFDQLDSSLQSLMSQGAGSTFNRPFSIKEMKLVADNASTMQLRFTYDSTAFSKSATLEFTRFVVQMGMKSNVLAAGQKRYAKGVQNQDFFVLNYSLSGFFPWQIINATRPAQASSFANISLAYRPKLYATFEGTTLVLRMIFVKFKFIGKSVVTSSEPSISVTYDGLIENTTQMFDGTQFFPSGGTLTLSVITTLSDGSPAFIEIPFRYGASSFYLKTLVEFHQFTVNI